MIGLKLIIFFKKVAGLVIQLLCPSSWAQGPVRRTDRQSKRANRQINKLSDQNE